MPSKISQRRLALEAARLMVERVETEYLHAKERAILMLGLPYHTPYPTNRQIQSLIQPEPTPIFAVWRLVCFVLGAQCIFEYVSPLCPRIQAAIHQIWTSSLSG